MAEALWELIQKMPHECVGLISGKCIDAECFHCQFEAWARDKAKEWESGKIRGTDAILTVSDCIDDLGVPEESQ